MTEFVRRIAITLFLVFGAVGTLMAFVVDWEEFYTKMFGEDQAILSLSTFDAILILAVWCVVGALIWFTWRKGDEDDLSEADLRDVAGELQLFRLMASSTKRWDEDTNPQVVRSQIAGFLEIAKASIVND